MHKLLLPRGVQEPMLPWRCVWQRVHLAGFHTDTEFNLNFPLFFEFLNLIVLINLIASLCFDHFDRFHRFRCFTVPWLFWWFWSLWLFHSASTVLITFDLFDCFTVLPLFWSFRSIWLFDSALIFVNAWMSGCPCLAICKQPAKLQWSHPWQPLNQLQRMSGRQGQPPQKILHLSLGPMISDISGHTGFFKWNANDTSYYHALSCHISELAALVGIVNAGKHSKRASGCLTISCLAMIRMCLQPKTDQPFSLKTLQYIVLRSINHWHP